MQEEPAMTQLRASLQKALKRNLEPAKKNNLLKFLAFSTDSTVTFISNSTVTVYSLLGINMETITEQDAYFLVALNASEESSVVELKWDFGKWNFGSIDVGKIIRSLISDGAILMSEREGDTYKDYSITGSCEIAEKWNEIESLNTIIFLTEAGESRWKTDDWGIKSERVKYLMFTKQSSGSRVQ